MRLNILTAFSLILVSSIASAQTSPQQMSLQGRILKPDGSALEGASVQFTLQVRSPGTENCILYEEKQTLNMTASDGIFSLTLGTGTRTGTNFKDTSTLYQAFSNTIGAISSLNCASGTTYTPATTHLRKLRVTFNDGSGSQTITQDQVLEAVPYALYADTLQGRGPSDFVSVISSLESTPGTTQSRFNQIINTDYTGLTALIAGTSSLYAKATPTSAVSFNSQRLTSVADPTGAQDAATKNYSDTKIGGNTANLGTLVVGDANKVVMWDGTKFVAQAVPADATKLSLSGGTMTGAINMGGQNITSAGHVQLNNQATLLLGRYTTAQETTLVSALAAADEGRAWFNSDTNKIRFWNGSAAQDVGSSAGTVTSVSGTAPVQVATGTSTPVISVDDATGTTKGIMQVGTGLSVASGVVSVAFGSVDNTAVEADSIPNCTAAQKLQRSLGPTFSWSCVADDTGTDTGMTALTGDVTASGSGSQAATIANDAVTFAKMQNVTTNKLLGRATAGSGDTEEITLGTALSYTGTTLNVTESDPTVTAFAKAALPTCAAGEVLKGNGTSLSCVTDNAGGLTNFTESVTTAAPNATVPVVRFLATNAATDVDVALSPKGTGALLAHVPTSTATGGNKRGQYAVDWQTSRANANQVASGNYSVVSGGYNNKATTTGTTVVGGMANTASGVYATASGFTTTASGEYSFAAGRVTTAEAYGQTTLGIYNMPKGSEQFDGWVATDPLFVVGNGTGAGASRSTALMLLKNGNLGLGVLAPDVKLQVSGTLRVGDGGETCASGNFTGGIRYNGGNLQFCNGTSWQTLGVSGAGITALTGDVTASGSGSVAGTIAADAVTFAKMQNIATNKIIGRGTAGSGDMEEITLGSNLALSGTTLNATDTGMTALTGDVTASGSGSQAATIANDAVTFAKMQNINTARILGRTTASSGDVEEISAGAGITLASGSIAVNFGNVDNTAVEADSIPNCTAAEKLQRSLGPTFSWSCVSDQSSDSSKVAKAGDTMTGTLNLPANGLVLGTSQLVAAGSGVGVGTATISGTKFKVVNNDYTKPIAIFEDACLGCDVGPLIYNNTDEDNSSAAIKFGSNVSGSPYIHASILGMRLSSAVNSALTFNTMTGGNLTEKMRVMNDGKVGVGTTSPSALFDVKGTFAMSGATSGAVKFAVPAAAGSATYTWPSAAPGSNMFLQSDSSGNLSWTTPGGSGDFLKNGTVAMTGTFQGLAGTFTSNSADALAVGPNGTTNPVLKIDASTASSATGVSITGAAAGGGVNISAISSGLVEDISLSSKGATSQVNIRPGGSTRAQVTASRFVLLPGTTTNAAWTHFSFSGAADTNLTASTEAVNVDFNMAQTRQHATGALALQRDFRIQPTTHSFIGASTLTDAATLAVDGPAKGGTNATITNSSAIYVPTSAVTNVTNSYGLNVAATTGATNNYAAAFTGGNVGVGLANPKAKLQIKGANSSTINIANSYLHLGGSEQNANGNRLITFGYYTSETYPRAYMGFQDTVATNSGYGDLVFGTRGDDLDAAAPSERMRILSSGNVGIGTTNPSAPLEVKGTFSMAGSTSGAVKFAVPAAAGSATYTWPAAAPASNMVLQSNSSGTLSWVAAGGGGSGDITNGGNTTGAEVTIGTNDAQKLSFETNNVKAMTIDSAGKVGIGTTSPTSIFEVQGGTAAANTKGKDITLVAQASGETTGNTGGSVVLTSGAGAGGWADGNVEFNVGNGTVNLNRHNSAVYASSSASEDAPYDMMKFVNWGNANGASALQQFWVTNGDGWLDQLAYFGAVASSGASNYTPALVWGQKTGATAYSERMRISSSGNVGIGTTNPTTALQVNGVITPSTDNTRTLGSASLRFTTVYATNSTINTSDRRQKKEITQSDLGLDFINSLEPVSYRWKEGDDKDLHYGLIAQDTEQAIQDAKVKAGSDEKSGIIDYDKESDRYGIRYTELIAPIIKAVQELYNDLVGTKREIASLKAENQELKVRAEGAEKQLGDIKAWICAKDPNAAVCGK